MEKKTNAKGKTVPKTVTETEKPTVTTKPVPQQPKLVTLEMTPEHYDIVVKYLASLPWGEVNHVINIVGQSLKRPQ